MTSSDIPDIVLPYAAAAARVAEEALRAWKTRTEAVNPAAGERVALLDAPGRVLARPVLADRDQPPFARSTRDGFACRAAELTGTLKVIGLLRAGEPGSAAALASGEALEIMTGAPVPAGADCVVMLEHVQRASDQIQLNKGRHIGPGDNIVPTGAEARVGATILPAHLRMEARHVGAAASVGCGEVEVFARPRVAILATGDELVDVGATPLLHQIRNSNSYSLAAQVRQAGGEAVILPVAHDSVESLRQSAREALKYDLLILSGGVSKGRYDFVKPVMASLGAEFLMTGAEIQPGKPVVFGRVAKASAAKHFFGLPGNPVSTLVTFALFVRPLLAALGGESGWSPRFVDARLARAFTTKTGLTRFLPCVLRNAGIETPEAEPVTWQGSGDLAATSHANAFFVVPPDREKIEAGERIHVLVE